MGVRAHRQPVDAAILIHEAVEVGIVNGTRLVAGGEIHQAVFQRLCVMERKPAAGDHIRQPTVFIEEFVEIQIVVSHHKFHVHVRELGLNVGGVLFIQVRVHKYTRMGSPSSSAVLPAQPARKETLIASVSSSAAIRLHVLSFIGSCPFKKKFCPLVSALKKTPSGRGTPTSESVLCSVYPVLDTASTQRGLCAALIDPAAKLLRACLLLRFKNPQSGGSGKNDGGPLLAAG